MAVVVGVLRFRYLGVLVISVRIGVSLGDLLNSLTKLASAWGLGHHETTLVDLVIDPLHVALVESGLGHQHAILVNQIRKLDQVFEDGVLVHVLAQHVGVRGDFSDVGLLLLGKDLHIDLLEADQGVNRASLSLGGLEEIFCPWIEPLVWVFSWPASAPAAGWGVSELAIGSLRVLLLHVSVKCGIG